MTTAQNLIDNVRGRLLSGMAEQRNQLAANYSSGSGTLTLARPTTGIGPGTRLSIGQTVFHVWDVNSGACTVLAGEDGSPDVSANAPAAVRVNPRFTDFQVFQEINRDLASLSSSGLFQMREKELVYNAAFDAFDLAGVTDLQQEYELYFQVPGSRREWRRLGKNLWRVERRAETTDFPSGLALRLFRRLHNGFKMRLLYKAPFTPLAAATTDMTTTGLPVDAYDLPELGAFIAMSWVREVKRNLTEAQPEPRRQGAAPSGGMLRAPQGVLQQRQRRLSEERARLHEQWSTRG